MRAGLSGIGGGGSPNDWLNGAIDGIAQGVTSIGLNYLVDEFDLNPLLANIGFSAISTAINGSLRAFMPGGNGDVFKNIYETYEKSAIAFLGGGDPTDPNYHWQQAAYIAQIQDMTQLIQERGLEDALNTYATGFFNSTAVNSIVSSGYTIGTYFTNKLDAGEYTVKMRDEKEYAEVAITDSEGNKVGDAYFGWLEETQGWDDFMGTNELDENGYSLDRWGDLYADYNNKVGYYGYGEIYNNWGDLGIFQTIQEGYQSYLEIKDNNGNVLFVVEPSVEGGYNYYNDLGEYLDVVIRRVNGTGTLLNNVVFEGGKKVYFTDTEYEGIQLKTTIDYDSEGNAKGIAYEYFGDSEKLKILNEVISGVDSLTGEFLTFGQRIAKGVSAFGDYVYGFVPNVSQDIASGVTAETFEKLGITRESVIESVNNFRNNSNEAISNINNWLIEKKAEGGGWEYLDCVSSLKPRIGLGDAVELSLTDGTKRGWDAFFGIKPGLISDGLLTQNIDIGTELGVLYGGLSASSFTYVRGQMFSDSDWIVETDTSVSAKSLAFSSDGSITMDFKFHKGFFGVEGSIDMRRMAVLIYEDIIGFYDKIIEKIW